MSESGPPVVITRDGDVALITLDRPQVRNAIDVETAAAICDAVTDCQDAAVIVITGTDPAFCAGLNLRSLGTDQLTDLPPFNATVAASRVPVIAAVNGPAVTGGFELALMADFIVASERALFADTHLRVGVYPGPVLVDLPRRVGMAWAREMSLTGNFVDAATALRIGIANHVVPHEELLSTAMRLAASIAESDRDMVATMREDWDATRCLTGPVPSARGNGRYGMASATRSRAPRGRCPVVGWIHAMTDANGAGDQPADRAGDGQAGGGRRRRSNIDRRRTRARSSPSQTYLNRRKELIDAAARVMSRKGVRETTLGDIAQEASTDRASIYYYFNGKEEMLAEILRSALTANTESIREIVGGPEPASVKLRRIVAAWMESYDAHFPYLYVWVYEDPTRLHGIDSAVLDEMVDLSQQGYELVREVIAEGMRSGEFRSALPVGVLAQSALGLVAWTYRWYEPNHDLTAREIAGGLADLLLSGLGAPSANSSVQC